MKQYQEPITKFVVKEDTSLGNGRTESAEYPKGYDCKEYQQTSKDTEQKVGGHEETYE
jgi:hypothetical protein